MANCQYIADSAPLPPPHILLRKLPASFSAARVRVPGIGSSLSATSFAIAA